MSFFSRANWSYGERYLLSASLRADGSSRFGSRQPLRHLPRRLGRLERDGRKFRAGARARRRRSSCAPATASPATRASATSRAQSLASGRPYSGSRASPNSQLGNPNAQVGDHEGGRPRRRPRDVRRPRQRDRRLVQPQHQRPARAAPDPGDERLHDRSGTTSARSATAASTSGCTRSTSMAERRGFGWTSDLNVTWNQQCRHRPVRRPARHLQRQQPHHVGRSRWASRSASSICTSSFGVDPDNGNAVFATADGTETYSPGSSDRMFVGSPQPKYYGGFTNTFTYRQSRPARLPAVQPGQQGVQHDAHLHR